MPSRLRILAAASALLAAAAGQGAFAQNAQTPASSSTQSPQGETPRPEDIDPAVDTSAPAQRAAPRPEEIDPAVDTSATAPAQGVAPQRVAPAPQAAPVAGKAPAQAAPPAQARAGASAAAPRSGRVLDRLDLETTEITGNRELPKVLYIVPWKRSDLGDLLGRPVNSLLDEVLEPVDRDVFKRENRYYRALQSDSAAAAAPAPP